MFTTNSTYLCSTQDKIYSKTISNNCNKSHSKITGSSLRAFREQVTLFRGTTSSKLSYAMWIKKSGKKYLKRLSRFSPEIYEKV